MANGETVADFMLPSLSGGGTDQFTLLKGSQVRAEVKGADLDAVKMDAAVRYDRNGEPLLEGRLSDAVYNVSDGTVSGKATVTLMKNLDRSTFEVNTSTIDMAANPAYLRIKTMCHA